MRLFPGGHFYLEAQSAAVLADLSATLAPMLQRNGPCGAKGGLAASHEAM
jgi:surfactin synthase thioesterase subunit